LAQDDDTFAAMLWNSISASAVAVTALKAHYYTINGVISSLLLFNCLLINSKVQASHNAGLLCRKLTKALQLMREAGHNVTDFINVYRGLIDQLNQVGQTFDDGEGTCGGGFSGPS
jgi:hypothetical protein